MRYTLQMSTFFYFPLILNCYPSVIAVTWIQICITLRPVNMHYTQACDGQDLNRLTPQQKQLTVQYQYFNRWGKIKNTFGRITFIFIYCTIILLYSLYKNKKNGDRVEKWIARKGRISSAQFLAPRSSKENKQKAAFVCFPMSIIQNKTKNLHYVHPFVTK